MPSKRKKTTISGPRRVYTTRQIMELTEQRRLKEEAANKVKEPVPVAEDLKLPPILPVASPQIIKEVETFVSQVNVRPSQEKVESKSPFSVFVAKGLLVFNLSLTAFLLMVSLRLPESWVNSVAAKLNSLIVYGSFYVFHLAQLPCILEGSALNIHFYKLSLHGDLVALYSLELLTLFAVLFAFIQKAIWVKRAMIFISLIPLVIVANIFRVLWACGLALNYGTVSADRYFHGALVDFVFVFVVAGLILFEFLAFSD